MDTLARPETGIRVLLETRPALDSHAGIPQQTRLLFRGLSLIPELEVEGLLQSSTHALAAGVPRRMKTGRRRLEVHKKIDRLARIVIMLEQRFLRSHLSAPLAAIRRLCGFSEHLTRFETGQFRDFIWRRLFSKSLPSADFEVVTKRPFRVVKTPWSAMHISSLIFKYIGLRVFPRLDTEDFDVMIAETPYPASVSKNTLLIIRYHDAIPVLMPHTISDRRYHQAFHYRALRKNVESGAFFVCVSEATRKDLLSMFPEVESRSETIHNVVSHDYFDEPSSADRVPEIIRTRLHQKGIPRGTTLRSWALAKGRKGDAIRYLLMVSTIEPRKNHLTLLAAWERLRASAGEGLKLVLVGSLGWSQGPIMRKLIPWIARGEVFLLEDVPSPDLRLLYKHARVTVCPSFAEGFDLSGVEAMKSGGAVIASDIPVHREVFSHAAEYFNPYSTEDLVRAIEAVIDPMQYHRRDELVALGATVAARFDAEVIMQKWRTFLTARALAPGSVVR